MTELLKDLLPGVLRNLREQQKKPVNRLRNEWGSIAGAKISAHTRPSLGREGKLYIWVDQAALAFELNQKYRQGLLKRVQAVVGEEAVKSVHFRVGQLRN